jgi:hypothetical protein
MTCAKVFIVLVTLAVSAQADDQSACQGLPVKTSDAAICRVELFVAKSNRKYPATNEAKEHDDHWLVLHIPTSAGHRSGGARFKVDKATGNVELVELLEFISAPRTMPNTSGRVIDKVPSTYHGARAAQLNR